MISKLGAFLLCGFGAAGACTIFPYFLKGEETAPGVYRVLQGSGSHLSPAWTEGPFDTLENSFLNDFRTQFTDRITGNELVFMGRLDSIIEDVTDGRNPPAGPFPVPAFVLASSSGSDGGEVYLRLKVDTLLKGDLPSGHFWMKSRMFHSTCGENFNMYKGVRFLNYSDGLDSLSDLKLSPYVTGCTNCPVANTFDGWHLRSPEFPVLRLDIREVLPNYPVSLNSISRPRIKIPLRAPGKSYLPDGRVAPSGEAARRRAPIPLLK